MGQWGAALGIGSLGVLGGVCGAVRAGTGWWVFAAHQAEGSPCHSVRLRRSAAWLCSSGWACAHESGGSGQWQPWEVLDGSECLELGAVYARTCRWAVGDASASLLAHSTVVLHLRYRGRCPCRRRNLNTCSIHG